jgi:hypothetical protein
MIPHEGWGYDVLAAIDRHVPLSPAGDAEIGRIIHLAHLPGNGNAAVDEQFPVQLAGTVLPAEAAGLTWQRQCNDLNTVWHSGQTRHALWTAPADGFLRFHLPWDLILLDLAALGGGLIHAGVAVRNRLAWLFLAPPGGGKSTTLATAPPEWRVLSDDAAMIWPAADGRWQLYPLLSWSSMLTPPTQPDEPLAVLSATFPVGGMLTLNKATDVRFERLPPVTAAAQVYCALTQYPAIFLGDHIHQEAFFRSACRLAREVPCWQLDLPLGGDIWPGVAGLERSCQ